jgi:protein FrlC
MDYFLDCAQRAGFLNIELWCGASHFWLDSSGHENCAVLKKKLASRGLKVVSLVSPSCSYQYQYAAMTPFHLERSRRYFLNGIHAASELGAKIVAVNSGWGYDDETNREMWSRSSDNLRILADYAAGFGVALAMESMRNDETNIVNSLASTRKMYEEAGHPNLKIMVDTIASGAAGETLSQWFDEFGDDLIHMHFLDGDPYVHNIWGDGNTSLEAQLAVMEERGYRGYLVQEIADERYFADPFSADIKNMRVLERFLTD